MAALMSIEQLAETLQVPVKTIYDWRARPVPYGPQAIKVGRYLRWKPEVVDAWIDAQGEPSNVTPIRAAS